MPLFLEIVLILLFETNISMDMKQFYLLIIQNMVVNSIENAVVFRKSQLIDKLIFYLRFERNELIKEMMASILVSCLKVKFSLSQLQTIMQFMSPFEAILLVPFFKEDNLEAKRNYQQIANALQIPKKAIECYSERQYDEMKKLA